MDGLTVSKAPGDVPIRLFSEAGPNEPEVPFNTTATVLALDAGPEVEVIVEPESGKLGTEITVTLNPAVPPVVFDSSSLALWSGVFDPLIGPPSAPFSVLYEPDQVHELNAASAILVFGDGTVFDPPDITTLDFPGTFEGTLTLFLGGTHTLTTETTFTPTVAPAVWESITYLDSSVAKGPPVLNGEPEQIETLLLSKKPNPIPEEELLLAAKVAHLAVVLRIDENPTTLATAPAFVLVDLVTFDDNHVEVDRVEGLQVNKISPDGDPDHIVYHSNLAKPVVLVDRPLNQENYPNVVVLQAAIGGTAQIVPAAP